MPGSRSRAAIVSRYERRKKRPDPFRPKDGLQDQERLGRGRSCDASIEERRPREPPFLCGGITEASYLPYIGAGSAWVAERPDGIVGFAAIDLSSETVWALFVDPETEGAGIGRALHSAMLEWAREQGIRRLSLTTETGSRAMHFYERAGWTQAATTADGELTFERSLLI